MIKMVGLTLELIAKAVFSLDKYQLKNMGRKLQHIKIEKVLLKCPP